MARENLGEFEQLVLLACLRLEDRAYALAIRDDIEERTRRRPSQAAVYVALRRLENKGLVSSRLGEPTPERGGRAKRFFEVRPIGVTRLRESRRALESMWQGLETLLG